MSVSRSRRDALGGVRVALLEARRSSEMAELVRRYGGTVRSVPAVREAPLDCAGAVTQLLARLETPARRVHIFLTAAGTTALLLEAERQNRLPFLVGSLRQGTIVCRGPKPAAALKPHGLSPSISTPSPYTTTEMLNALGNMALDGAEVTIVHYGERSEPLAAALRRRGARLHELCVYEWRMPDDIAPLQDLVRAIVQREIDAVIFTSQVQWKHLRRVATGLALGDDVVRALRTDVVTATIGPICSAALIESGVQPHVVPDNPKMGPLVAALAQYFSIRPNALPDS